MYPQNFLFKRFQEYIINIRRDNDRKSSLRKTDKDLRREDFCGHLDQERKQCYVTLFRNFPGVVL